MDSYADDSPAKAPDENKVAYATVEMPPVASVEKSAAPSASAQVSVSAAPAASDFEPRTQPVASDELPPMPRRDSASQSASGRPIEMPAKKKGFFARLFGR